MARAWFGWWLGVSGFIFGLLAAVVLATGFAILYWEGKGQVQTQAAEATNVYSRNDFATSVFGKSEDQVLEAVGKPDKTSEDAQATYWHYLRRTRNPATGQTDSDVQVVFERGQVIAINY